MSRTDQRMLRQKTGPQRPPQSPPTKWIFLAASMLAACDSNQAPPFPEGQGQSPDLGAPYPAGPYGIAAGQVIQNFKFLGYPNPAKDKQQTHPIELADFWNPTGTDTYPEGSPLGLPTELKPTVLLLVVSAVWCGPCQYESAELLPPEHAKYQPRGAQFLLQLADGPSPGSPAELSNLTAWTTKYESPFPAVIDPSYKLGSQFSSNAFPANILIDTKTMEVLEIVAGIPEEDSSFFQQLEEHLRE